MYYLIGKSGKQAIVFSRDRSRGNATIRGIEVINHFKEREMGISDIECVSVLPYSTVTWPRFNLNMAMEEVIRIIGGLKDVF